MSRDERLARLGLLHLRNDPAALKKALDELARQRDEEVAAGRRELEELRQARARQAENTAPETPPRRTSTLAVLTLTPGLCRECRHVNQDTFDARENRWCCGIRLGGGPRRGDQTCNLTIPLRRSRDGEAEPYFFFERYDGSNGTWGRLQNMRLLAEDADEQMRRDLHADVPIE